MSTLAVWCKQRTAQVQRWFDDHPRFAGLGKTVLVLFVLFEISQLIIGVCGGVYVALEYTGII